MNTANKLITHKRPILLGNCRNLFLLLSKNIKRRTAPLASHAALDAERASAGREKPMTHKETCLWAFSGIMITTVIIIEIKKQMSAPYGAGL